MPLEKEKEEIVRRANELAARLKNGTYKSAFSRGFAEVFVESQQEDESESIPKAIPIARHPLDEKQERFMEMRRLACLSPVAGYRVGSGDSLQAVQFYKQARFMENFEDDYEGNAPFSMYFPSYQMMGYEQLRTYFTWRSLVRRGVVNMTSLSYAFLYLYELINNVGARDCRDGLDKLAAFWNKYREYDGKLDPYMSGWVRDYYITNDFSVPFEELLQNTGNLKELYRPTDPQSLFDFYCPYSDYKIKKSIFYTAETAKTMGACFDFVIRSLNAFLRGGGREFENLVFYGRSNSWTPFQKALYCSFSRQLGNRTVRLSETEAYRYENGRWMSSRNRIPKENGRFLVGYILKRIEQFFRRKENFKYKLTANRKKISVPEIARAVPNPERLFTQIDAAIVGYYRQSQRKTVTVDAARLEAIRAGARRIQEKLLEGGEEAEMPPQPVPEIEMPVPAEPQIPDPPLAASPAEPAEAGPDIWDVFARSLSETEKAAVRLFLRDASSEELLAFSRNSRVMPEVLADGINQKALDAAGDSILEFTDKIRVFEEYRDDLKRVIGIECQ
jgi:hypothetical protein